MEFSDDKMWKKFLGGCQSPKNIVNIRGEQITVACGKCLSCLSKRQSRYEKLSKDMASVYKYAYFYTLTYDEDNVPRCVYSVTELHSDCYSVSFIDVSTKRLKTKIKYSDRYGKEIAQFTIKKSDCTFDKFNDFIEQSCPTNGKNKDLSILRVLDNSDLQKFIKRLRFKIADKFDEKISHFSVSEYGPVSFRPHFHGVLFFNSDQVAKVIEKYVSQCWKYGNCECEIVRDRSNACSYVSGYINSLVALPPFLEIDAIKPKIFHSVKTLFQVHKEVRDFIYECPSFIFDEFTLYHNGNPYEFFPTRVLQNSLFPRCYNFSRQSDESKVFLYSIYSKLSEKTKLTKVSDLTRYVIINYLDYTCNRFLRLLEIYTYRSDEATALYFRPHEYANVSVKDLKFTMRCIEHFGSLDIYESIYQRIYTSLDLSKHFLTFCCENKPFQLVYTLLSNFHNYTAPLRRLRSMYLSMIQFNQQTNSTNYGMFFSTGSYFDYDALVSFPAIGNELIKDDVLMKQFFDDVYYQVKNNIKHRELNELNYQKYK